jgi:hypothetical protein
MLEYGFRPSAKEMTIQESGRNSLELTSEMLQTITQSDARRILAGRFMTSLEEVVEALEQMNILTETSDVERASRRIVKRGAVKNFDRIYFRGFDLIVAYIIREK